MPTPTTIPNCRPNCSISRTLRDGFALSLRAEGKSPKTLTTYLEAIDKLLAFVQERGMPDLPSMTAEHLREFFGALYATGNKPATVSNRYRALKRFFSWLRGWPRPRWADSNLGGRTMTRGSTCFPPGSATALPAPPT